MSCTGAHQPLADRDTRVSLSLVVEPPLSEVQILFPKSEYNKTPPQGQGLVVSGRDERIRTSDILHPMQALYQAELRPEYMLYKKIIIYIFPEVIKTLHRRLFITSAPCKRGSQSTFGQGELRPENKQVVAQYFFYATAFLL